MRYNTCFDKISTSKVITTGCYDLKFIDILNFDIIISTVYALNKVDFLSYRYIILI